MYEIFFSYQIGLAFVEGVFYYLKRKAIKEMLKKNEIIRETLRLVYQSKEEKKEEEKEFSLEQAIIDLKNPELKEEEKITLAQKTISFIIKETTEKYKNFNVIEEKYDKRFPFKLVKISI